MQVCRETAAIKELIITVHDVELRQWIAKRIEEWSEYEPDLAELVNIFVIEPGDTLNDIDAELGFSLLERPIDVVESRHGWYELTIILSDGGFGVVLYVPKADGTDTQLLALCQAHVQESSTP